jgi:hypothetical protein
MHFEVKFKKELSPFLRKEQNRGQLLEGQLLEGQLLEVQLLEAPMLE